MRLWKVRTLVELRIDTNIFNKTIKCNKEWFTHGTRFIYAKTKEEAIEKYRKNFYVDLSNEYNKFTLKYMDVISETTSDTMTFYLPFYKDVGFAKETIMCSDEEVYVSIDVLRNKMSATDFRDWWHNNN